MKNMQYFFRKHAVLFLLASLPLASAGQDVRPFPPDSLNHRAGATAEEPSAAAWEAEDFWETLQEESAQEEGFSPALWEENRDEWEALMARPLDLNRATRRELERIPFLTPLQVEQLLDYRARHGAFRSLQELQLIEAFDRQTLRLVAPFLRVVPPEGAPRREKRFSLRRDVRQEIRLKASVPLYEREGYRKKSVPELMDNPDAMYLGPPVAHSLRYSLRLGDWLQAGMTASNDAGEPFFKGANRKGYDSYSFYLLYRGSGLLHTLALGKYRIDLGQGLIMGNGFLSSKGASLPVAGLSRGKLRAHSSTDEYNYLNGAAFVVQPLRQLRIAGFYSYRRLDGRLENDTLLSISTDGYHRLPREVERKRAAVVQTAGGSVQYLGTFLEVGLNAVGYFFSKPYEREPRSYNTYYFRGRRGGNASADYRLTLRNGLQLSGEIAFDPDGKTALLQAVRLRLPGEWQGVAIYRRYDMRYKSFYACSFSEGGYVQNEEGLYIGAAGMLPGRLHLTVYADLFRFPYAKYGVSTASKGYDLMGRLEWTPHEAWRVEAYYRYKEKGKNLSSDALAGEERTTVNPYATHRAKLQLYCTPRGEELQLKTALLFARAGHRRGHRRSNGWLVGQAALWKPRRLPTRASAGIHYFHTDDYDARLYVYEYSLPYTFSVPSFYGRGMRLYALLRWDGWGGRLALVGKYGLTRYFDREEISSGLQLIRSSCKQDVELMLRLKW